MSEIRIKTDTAPGTPPTGLVTVYAKPDKNLYLKDDAGNETVLLGDSLVKVSVADTTNGYLGTKLVAGSNISLNIINPGGNEQLEISNTITTGDISTSTSGITIVSGTDSTVGPDVTIDIDTASSSLTGLLSSTDWNTFNNKQNALTPGNISTTTTGVSVGSGANSTIGPNVTVDIDISSTSLTGLLNSTDWNTFNNKVTTVASTDKYYVDGELGVDVTATGNLDKPFKTIQACLNLIGQPTSHIDAMRHIEIHISDKLSATAGFSPQTFNGCYSENLTVPSRMITIYGRGVKLGDNGTGSGGGNILKEYSSSRRFGASSSELRPCLTLVGLENTRDSHQRLRNGFHVGGTCRTSILKRNLDSIQGDGTTHVTIHVAPGQFTYPITVTANYPTEPYIRIAVQGTTNYNATYDITSQIDSTTFTATRVSGTNASVALETSGTFFESDSAGASGITHDSAFHNCYMQGAYTCDDGTVNGAASTAGTEVLYSIGSRFFTGMEGRGILCQRWESTTLAGASIVSSIAGMNNCSFAGTITTSTFTYSTDDMGFMNCRFNSAVPITVSSAGQTVRMDGVTYNSFLGTASSWVTNTPTIDYLDQDRAIKNTSTVSGTTVKDALNTLSSAATGYSILSISSNTSAVNGKTYLCDTSAGAFSVTFPTPTLNSFVTVKDSTGSFNTNNLTMIPNAGEKIEGIAANRILISNWSSTTFVANGTDWFML